MSREIKGNVIVEYLGMLPPVRSFYILILIYKDVLSNGTVHDFAPGEF